LAGLTAGAYGQCTNYTVTNGTGTIVPGTTNIGNSCDDCGTVVALPFGFRFYGTIYNSVTATSNGYVLFNPADNGGVYNENTYCIPATNFTGAVMYPAWSDGFTSVVNGGIFTSTSGVAPNRIFNIEWRNGYYNNVGSAFYEVRLYEGSARFDYVYGSATNNWNSTVGCQNAGGTASNNIQCNLAQPASGTMITFDFPATFPPGCTLNASPAGANQGGSVTALASVSLGSAAGGNAITTVSCNATDVGGGTVALHDDGVAPDVTAGDLVYSGTGNISAGTSTGTHTLTTTVTDVQARTSTCTRSLTVFPAGCNAEPEGCGVNNPDTADGGCNSTPNVYATANLGASYCGQCANSTAARDTDWWMFTMPAGSDTIAVSATAAFAAQSFILAPTCPATILSPAHTNGSGGDLSYSYSGLTPGGNYVFFVSPAGFDGSAVCGTNDSYSFTLQAAQTGACCSDAGCQVMTNIACASAGGHFNGAGTNCGGGTWTVTTGTGTVVPGVDDSGNHIDDGQNQVTLPFAYSFYGTSYNDLWVSSNGNIQFGTPTGTFPAAYTNDCLPSAAQIGSPMIAPHWDDQMTNLGGIFTTTTGVAPNRVFHVEFRTGYYPDTTVVLNYEVRLYEGQTKFDIVYGTVPQGGTGATVGVQASSAGPFQQFECNTGGLTGGMMLTYTFASTGDPCQPQGGCTADFNCDGDVGTDLDIESFFACLAGTCPAPPCANTADFNNDGDVGTDADIESFFRVLAGGPC